jgi:excisionase family DNA binding protein
VNVVGVVLREESFERFEAFLDELRKRLDNIEEKLKPTPTAVSFEAAAQMLSCSSKHIGRLVKDGTLRTCMVGSNMRRIPVSAIHDLMAGPVVPKSSGASVERVRFDADAARAKLRELQKKSRARR